MIVFDKLGNYLKANNMKYIDLQRQIKLSPSVVASFQKNRNVTTETINKICEFLKVQPNEIMEWIPDAEYNEKNAKRLEIERQIEALQKQLTELKRN